MECRLINLQTTLAGYLKTGMPLIASDGEKTFQPLTGDDIGIYVLIPKIAKLFNIELATAINIFLSSLLIFPLLVGCIAFWLLYKNWLQRFVSIAALVLLTRFAYAVGDVYLASSAAAISIIPWSLYLKKSENSVLLIFGFLSGLLAGFLHYIRAYSSIAPLLFILIIVISRKDYQFTNKLLFILVLGLGFLVGASYFEYEYKRSVNYATKQLGLSEAVANKHVFWHQVYIGLGLIHVKNRDEIRYDDSVASEKVKSLDASATYCSPEYENALKSEFFKLLKEQLLFIILTLFTKLGILFYFLIKFANVGIFAAFVHRKPLVIDFAFSCALCFSSIFCLVAIPLHEYALGFISCTTLWSIVSINYMLSALSLKWFKLPTKKETALIIDA